MMRRVASVFLLIVLILTSFHLSTTKAQDFSISWIDASFRFRFLNGTSLNLELQLDVHNITLFNRVYGADEIREMHQGEGAAGVKVFDYSSNILSQIFEGCNIELGLPRADPSTLDIPKDADLCNPPVTFYIEGNISLSGDFFDFNLEDIEDIVNGLLDVGAKVTYDFDFLAPPFWNISYIFEIPDNLSIKEVGKGIVSIDGKEVKWEIENWRGKEEKFKDGYLSIQKVEPTYHSQVEEIHSNLVFNLSGIDFTTISITLNVSSLDLSGLVDLPSFIEVDSYVFPSDCIRLLLKYDLIDLQDLENILIDKWINQITDLRNALKRDISFDVYLDNSTITNCFQPYNISHMDKQPPLVIEGKGTPRELLGNLSTRAVLGIVYSGGEVRLNDDLLNLDQLRYPFEAEIVLPYGEIYTWNQSMELNITLNYTSAPRYSMEKKERLIEVNLRSLDLDVLAMFTGKSKVVSNLEIMDCLSIYTISTSSLVSLPEWVNLRIMNSDLFRLLFEEGVLSEGLNRYIEERMNSSKDILTSLLGQNNLKVYFDEKRFEESLDWDKKLESMDDLHPVNISFFSTLPKKARFSFSIIPFSFTIMNESFDCFSIPGENVTYRFIFPKGVEVSFNDSLGISRKGVLNDGREYIEICFPKSEGLVSTTLYYSMKLSPLMILLLFLPIIVMIIIVVAIVSVVLLLKKRRRFRPKVPEYREISDEETGNFR